MILDDQRIFLPKWANIVLSDPEANKYASGVGVHWYWDNWRSSDALTKVHNRFQNKFILYTEACAGFQPLAAPVILGSWERAEQYAYNIIDNMRHFVSGWVDWNLFLSMEGGPNWVKNFVDAPIIVDSVNQRFFKQPTYYAMGHFSKFVPRKSVRVGDNITVASSKVHSVSFLRPDGLQVSVLLNTDDLTKLIRVQDAEGKNVVVELQARSIASVIW